MDIMPTGASVLPTSAVDALRRVSSAAASGDSEDSQSGSFLFGDGKKASQREDESGEQIGESTAIEDAIELSDGVMAGHTPVAAPTELADEGVARSASKIHGSPLEDSIERHIDIEA